MRNEYKVFLGVDKNGEAVYAEVTFGSTCLVESENAFEADGKPVKFPVRMGHFSVCFTSCYMEVYNDELLSERMAEILEGAGNEYIGDLLVENPDVSFNELPNYILQHDGREAVLDIDHFFPEFTLDNGDEVAWTFSSAGQHDTRRDFLDELVDGENEWWVWHEDCEPVVDMELYMNLNELWDKYHLTMYTDMSAEDKVVLEEFEKEFHEKADEYNNRMEEFLKQYVNRMVEEQDTKVA